MIIALLRRRYYRNEGKIGRKVSTHFKKNRIIIAAILVTGNFTFYFSYGEQNRKEVEYEKNSSVM